MNLSLDRLGRRASDIVLDALFPPRCISCRNAVATAGALCAPCWDEISFIEGPMCSACGMPFEIDPGEGTLCAACLAYPPAFDRARAVMRYDEASRGLILALKWADRLDLAPGFARWLNRSGRALIDECDVIVPVPLHRFRLWQRRYNQSALLAKGIARLNNKTFDALSLTRTRHTPSQGEMTSAKARRRNVKGAFAVKPSRAGRLAGKSVLLVDDVFTTGATLNACAKALKAAGATHISVLALARVVRAISDGA
ncbi:MAG TPA: ComF family protein [Rhizomicrobium sp.]|jgi:ComF family protein|nr:ComF family protein [Rhizomicrobium sp.]